MTAALALALTGCIKMDMDLELQSDDTVNGSLVFGVSHTLVELSGEDADSVVEEMQGDLLGTDGDLGDVTTEPFSDDEFVGTTTHFTGAALDAFSSGEEDALSIVRDGDDYVVSGTMDLSNEGEGDDELDLGGLMSGFDIRIAVTFPGAVTDHNGELNGSTVVWTPKVGERVEMSARGPASGGGAASGEATDDATDDGATTDDQAAADDDAATGDEVNDETATEDSADSDTSTEDGAAAGDVTATEDGTATQDDGGLPLIALIAIALGGLAVVAVVALLLLRNRQGAAGAAAGTEGFAAPAPAGDPLATQFEPGGTAPSAAPLAGSPATGVPPVAPPPIDVAPPEATPGGSPEAPVNPDEPTPPTTPAG